MDETGDRGSAVKSSAIFVLSAIVVRDDDMPPVLDALERIKTTLGKPQETTLHWADNIKKHDQRKMVARELGALPLTITNVIIMKRHLDASTTRLTDPASMYNYAVRRMLERVSWLVEARDAEAVVTFAHVRRFPYDKFRDYLERLQASTTEIKWAHFTGKPKIDQPGRVPGLQAADLVAGCLWAALSPDKYGDYEVEYLRSIYKLIHVGSNRKVTSYGMNVVGRPGCMDLYPWWPRFVAACAKLPPA